MSDLRHEIKIWVSSVNNSGRHFCFVCSLCWKCDKTFPSFHPLKEGWRLTKLWVLIKIHWHLKYHSLYSNIYRNTLTKALLDRCRLSWLLSYMQLPCKAKPSRLHMHLSYIYLQIFRVPLYCYWTDENTNNSQEKTINI